MAQRERSLVNCCTEPHVVPGLLGPFSLTLAGAPAALLFKGLLSILQQTLQGPQASSPPPRSLPASPAGVSCLPFQALKQLTYLHIGVDICDSTCAHLSSLTALQQLHVSKYAAISSAGLAQIGALAQLTCLRINGAPYVIDPVTVPGFSALSGLKHLEVSASKELNPAVLDGLTGLEHLAVVQTAINPRGVSPSAAAGVPTLLAVLPRMQQLTHLNLSDCLSWPQPLHTYAALTASPRLVKLVLRSCHFPSGICEHLFGAPGEGRLRAQLTHLVIHSSWPVNITLEAGDVQRVVACCPGLRHLDVDLGKQVCVATVDRSLRCFSFSDFPMPSRLQGLDSTGIAVSFDSLAAGQRTHLTSSPAASVVAVLALSLSLFLPCRCRCRRLSPHAVGRAAAAPAGPHRPHLPDNQ